MLKYTQHFRSFVHDHCTLAAAAAGRGGVTKHLTERTK